MGSEMCIRDRHQHAYRRGMSKTTALIEILDKATELYDDRTKTGFVVMSLDFSRAFDKVHHSTLLQKLADATLPSDLVLWIKNYLAERSYQQGSALGPVIFATLVGDVFCYN